MDGVVGYRTLYPQYTVHECILDYSCERSRQDHGT